MVFDTWGGLLSDTAYREFSLAYVARVMAGLQREGEGRRVPRIAFTKGGGQWLDDIAGCGCDAVGLDWTTNIGSARKRVGARVALQGNLDPVLLTTTPDAIVTEARRIIDSYGPHPGHVFNLGHGILPTTPVEHVEAAINMIHKLSMR
jgi:uroporphyrinogen decarboxylase